jgi:hypothetical protein
MDCDDDKESNHISDEEPVRLVLKGFDEFGCHNKRLNHKVNQDYLS